MSCGLLQQLTMRVKRVCEGGLLGGVDGQAVVVFDLNPSDDVGALEGVERGEPSGWVLVAFGLVEVVSDGHELGSSEVVGELLTASGRPIAGSANPGFLQRDYVVLSKLWFGCAVFEILELVGRTISRSEGKLVGTPS